MIKENIFLQKTTHLANNLKNECTGTLKYIGCTIEFRVTFSFSIIFLNKFYFKITIL